MRVQWGEDDSRGEIGVGAHRGWIQRADGERVTSRAIAVDAVVPLGRFVEVRGEYYGGQALRGLGGGGIGQNLTTTGDPVRDRGGWGQLVVRPSTLVDFGAGCGVGDPKDVSESAGQTAQERRVRGSHDRAPRWPRGGVVRLARSSHDLRNDGRRAEHSCQPGAGVRVLMTPEAATRLGHRRQHLNRSAAVTARDDAFAVPGSHPAEGELLFASQADTHRPVAMRRATTLSPPRSHQRGKETHR